MEKRSFSHFVDRVFWFLLTGAIMYAASEMSALSENVQELNKSMVQIVERVSNQGSAIDKLEKRVYNLEQGEPQSQR